ncbi:MAG: hypothetical protein MJY87_02865 [Fibrobacter sp.]|nr:hypothetical protein [Fibrobacter sp.]
MPDREIPDRPEGPVGVLKTPKIAFLAKNQRKILEIFLEFAKFEQQNS